MPEISAEEFDKRYGPPGTFLSIGAKMPLRSVPIYGHDMTKPFEERFHDAKEADKSSASQEELDQKDLEACRRTFDSVEQALIEMGYSKPMTQGSKPTSATDKPEKDPSQR